MTDEHVQPSGSTVVVLPQWQGSAAEDPQAVVEGAHRITSLLPEAAPRTVVDLGGSSGQMLDEVGHLDVLIRSAEAARAALGRTGEDPVLAVGGDCGIELGPVARAVARHGADLAVVWFDAHADINTPETSPSGGFHGMVLRTLLGDGPPALLPEPDECLSSSRVVLAGARALDDAEREFIEAEGIPLVPVADLVADPESLADAVAATGASHVYVHIDVDVLDPGHFDGISLPEPEGLLPAQLAAAVEALTSRFTLAGAGLTEHAPHPATDRDEETLRTLLPLLLR